MQEDEYYAFGLRKGITSSSNNRYLYNGKELQEGLSQYDYGARFYDPLLGRWNVPDPKAELLEMSSPYVYSLNSPVNFIDKDGELPIYINGRVSSNNERASKNYWDTQLLRTIGSSGIPNPGGTMILVDGDRGIKDERVSDLHGGTSGNATARKVAGELAGKRDFQKILSQLERDPRLAK
ncbi:RHS repeat-associated core domain-containing protein [Solitalea canadensis]|uniref:RHS repeat-associated core domain-containing protein n=1 Tax=Solitalea canadensis TaxID=995 RepID=UPI00247AA712|nr:RHS repeat-associated core domain-containing protein [Solitalea canadensis]